MSGIRRRKPGLLWYLVMGLVVFWVWTALSPEDGDRASITYTEFKEQLTSGNVLEVTVQGERIRGSLEEPAVFRTDGGEATQHTAFETFLPSFGDEELLPMLEEHNVSVETLPAQDTSWWQLLLSAAPFLLLIWLFFIMMRGMQGRGRQLFNIGKSKARLHEESDEDTTFDDVAGCEGAKEELREVVAFLKEPDRFHALGGEMPRGVLMVGPPGTGKTLLARAVAGEAEVPFYHITGSDFMEMFVGVGASRVRDLFEKAKESAPSIVFIDEIDSIGRQRGAGLGGGHDEREQTLNQLLSELDGFEPTHSVVVMAATNRPDILDPALLRPGRFDRRVTIHNPTQKDRLAILRIHAKRKPLDDDVDLEEVARSTPGLSGADLENILNEAALLAAREDRDRITAEDLDEARDKVLMGLERTGLVLSDEEQELLAAHEAGHAVLAAALPHTDPLHKVTIVPRGRAMGVTQQLPEKEQYIHRREYLEDRLAVTMGGRAAEELLFDTWSTGARDDLQQANQLARKMVLEWGMSDELGPVAAGQKREQVFLGEEIAQRRDLSEATMERVDQEVSRLVESAYGRAKATLERERDALEKARDLLLEKEEVSGEEIQELLRSSGGQDRAEQSGEGQEG